MRLWLRNLSIVRSFGRGLTIFALCLAVGLHWIALQSFAWTTMIVANARHASLAQAVAKTFSGSHPCDLCKKVSSAQHSSKKPQAQPPPAKPDLICTARVIQIAASVRDFRFPTSVIDFSSRIETPPVPPPRAAV